MARPWAGSNVSSTSVGGIPRAAWVAREEAVSALNPLPHGLPGCSWVSSRRGGASQQTRMRDHHGRRMAPWVGRAKADQLGRYHIPKPDRSRANGHNGGRREAMALLQVDNDRVSIKLKLPRDGPSSRDERGCSTGGPWVLPSSSGRYQSASRDIEPLRSS